MGVVQGEEEKGVVEETKRQAGGSGEQGQVGLECVIGKSATQARKRAAEMAIRTPHVC